MNKFIKIGTLTAAFALAAVMVIPVSAAPSSNSSNGNKLSCFSGTEDTLVNPENGTYFGTCTLVFPNGAELNTIDENTDPNNNYAGVYIQNTNLDGKLLADVNKLAFTYDGETAVGGSPRISIPIDENGDGNWDGFAYIDTLGCNDGDANTGTLDAINDSTCTIWYGAESYDNWAEFASENPTYTIATDALAFIIVDQPGEFTITNVQLGRGSARVLR
jgi:hypothetical protein